MRLLLLEDLSLDKRKKIFILFFLFLISILFYSFLLHGAEFNSAQGDDWDFYKSTYDLTYTELFQSTIKPYSSYLFYTFLFADESSVDARPVYYLTYKVLKGLFGTNVEYYFILKIVIFSLLVSLIFVFLYQLTKNSIFSLAGSLLFLTSVNSFPSMMWFADLAILADLFTLMALILFTMWHYLRQKGEGNWFLVPLILFFSALAIKTRPPAKMIGPIFLLFLLLDLLFTSRFNFSKILHKFTLKKYILPFMLTFIVITISLPLPTLFTSTNASSSPPQINFDHLYDLFFTHQGNIYGVPNGENIFFHPAMMKEVPSSLFGNFRFLLSWLIIISIFLLSFNIINKSHTSFAIISTQKGRAFATMLLSWLFVVLCLLLTQPFAGTVETYRYMITPLIVFCVFFPFICHMAYLSIQSRAKEKSSIFLSFFIIFTLVTLLLNTYSILNIKVTDTYIRDPLLDQGKAIYLDKFEDKRGENITSLEIFTSLHEQNISLYQDVLSFNSYAVFGDGSNFQPEEITEESLSTLLNDHGTIYFIVPPFSKVQGENLQVETISVIYQRGDSAVFILRSFIDSLLGIEKNDEPVVEVLRISGNNSL